MLSYVGLVSTRPDANPPLYSLCPVISGLSRSSGELVDPKKDAMHLTGRVGRMPFDIEFPISSVNSGRVGSSNCRSFVVVEVVAVEVVVVVVVVVVVIVAIAVVMVAAVVSSSSGNNLSSGSGRRE